MMLSFTKNETLLLDAYHKAGIFAASKMLIVTLTVYYSKTRYILKSKKQCLYSKIEKKTMSLVLTTNWCQRLSWRPRRTDNLEVKHNTMKMQRVHQYLLMDSQEMLRSFGCSGQNEQKYADVGDILDV